METVAVIDFETTGMSPAHGARATEIAAVLVRDGEIVGSYDSLMDAGAWIPPFIERLTGISNEMIASAPPAARVMREVADFVAGAPLVAHNASFDRRFWNAELARAGVGPSAGFACTMLLGRRVFPSAPDHRLATLVRYAGLVQDGPAHRALADARAAARLLTRIEGELRSRLGLPEVTHALLCEIQRTPRERVARCPRRR